MAAAGRYAATSHDSKSAANSGQIQFHNAKPRKNLSSLRKLLGGPSRRDSVSPGSSSNLSVSQPRSAADLALARPEKSGGGSMVKRLMGKTSRPEAAPPVALQIARDDLKKLVALPVAGQVSGGGGGGSNFSGLSKKLFQRSARPGKTTTGEIKALCEGKENTRTLGMVLRSERDLVNQNKVYEDEIVELRLALEAKDKELVKLRKICLKQREEIDTLKDSIVPQDAKFYGVDTIDDLEGMQDKSSSPSLQDQVKMLKMQLLSFAQDLAEVKSSQKSSADRHTYGDASSSWGSCDPVTPTRSLDEMFTKDLNPCLTPYDSQKSKDRLPTCYGSRDKGLSGNAEKISRGSDDPSDSLFMTSESYQNSNVGIARSVLWKSSQRRLSNSPIQFLDAECTLYPY